MAIETAPKEIVLAEPRRRLRDQQVLRRLCAWGGSATIALAAVAITAQTESGVERMQLAFETPPARIAAVAPITPRPDERAETQRLEAQVRALAADRDRLTTRLASLEHNLDDVTGSIQRQAALAAHPTPAPTPPTPAPQIASAPPAVSPPAAPAQMVIAPLAVPANTGTGATWPDAGPTQAATSAPDAVPLAPVRIANTPTSEPASEPPASPKPAEFGIDLGSASSVAALRAHWAAVKANYGPLLAGLQPVVAHDSRPGGTSYRLVLGPLPNAYAAVQLCARFAAARASCRPARFDGQRLAQQ